MLSRTVKCTPIVSLLSNSFGVSHPNRLTPDVIGGGAILPSIQYTYSKTFSSCLSLSPPTTFPAISSAPSNFQRCSMLNSAKSSTTWTTQTLSLRCSSSIVGTCMLWRSFCALGVIYWHRVGRVSVTKPLTVWCSLRS